MSGSRLGLVRLVIRLANALFGQDGDQFGQGQGQELDNNASPVILVHGGAGTISTDTYQDKVSKN